MVPASFVAYRNSWADYAKAIGIILVVFGHVARGVVTAGMVIDPATLAALTMLDSMIYSFHMPLFFFLSGLFFVESLAKRGRVGLVVSKLDTLIYPYLLWSLLQGSCEVVLSHVTNGHVGMQEVLALLWKPRAQFWFLYALFFVFVVCSLIYAKLEQRFFGLVLLLFSILFVFEKELSFSLIGDYVLGYSVFFALGVCFARSDTSLKNNVLQGRGLKRWMIVFAVAFVLGQALFHGYFGLNYSVGGLPLLALSGVSILFVALLSMCLASTDLHSHWFLRGLRFIGSSSMAIYLMHVLAGSGMRVILSHYLGVQSVLLQLSAGTLAGVLFPLLGLWCINRYHLSYLFAPPQALSVARWWAQRTRV